MKKLVTAACALAAGLALADGTPGVVSGNTVGYSEVAARENLTFYATQFRGIGVSTVDINSIQLDDDGVGNVGWGDQMQIVGPLGNASAIYNYMQSWMYMGEGTVDGNFWTEDGGYTVADVSFDVGDAVAIDNPNGYEFDIKNSGEVYTNDVSFAAQSDLNWTGNPFPAPINIQDIQLDDDGVGNVGWGDQMQIVGPLGNASAIYNYMQSWMYMGEGTVDGNFWTEDGGYTVADVVLEAGSGFAIDNPNGMDFSIVIACPYSL